MSRFIDADDAIETIARSIRVLGENPKACIFSADWVEDFLGSCPTVTPISIEKKTNYDWLVEEGRTTEFLYDLVFNESVPLKYNLWEKWNLDMKSVDRDGAMKDIADWLTAPHIDKDVFDEEEIHENCTVQILRNSATGEESIGWWKNE